MNIAHLLARAGRADGARTAIVVGTEPVADYALLARRAAGLASSFADHLALSQGDRVALVMRNCRAYLEALFACWWGGFTAVPVNARLHPREIAYILEHSGARLCVASGGLAEQVAGLRGELPQLREVLCADNADWLRLAAHDAAPVASVTAEEVAWLFYTSGTTGRPKGAMLNHRNLLAMTTSYFVDVDPIGPGDCILHPAPLSHGSGMYVLPHVAASAKHVISASGGCEPEELCMLIEAHPGATFFAAPTMVHRLVSSSAAAGADFRNLKTIVYGGGPMYVEDCKRAMALLGHKLAQIYGQGESPMTITALSKARHADRAHPRYECRLASVGVPHSVVEVIVADNEDRPLPAEETGEVLVRGETVMRGYWRDQAASAAALRGGWLHTGDLGMLDQDGFLTLKDRSKDLIISGGSNIYPREVEEVLLRHPGVAEVSVVGQPHRDWGEVVVAFVVGRAGGPPADAASLDALCLAHLARFKRPKRYVITDALPKNNYGKVLKTVLRERLSGQRQGK